LALQEGDIGCCAEFYAEATGKIEDAREKILFYLKLMDVDQLHEISIC